MPKILIADDNANIQKMVVASFEGRGIEVIAVGNGEAAVRKISELKPDLVLADIFMPVRNGYEVCEFVKKDQRFAEVPVILLVGAFDPLDEKEARRVGADGVLKKPFVPADPLIAMVMAALEKNPRVAAELAKMREAQQPAEPHPIAMEIPKRPEPKQLPDFPEPSSPEEAAIAYGFGSGKRALGISKGQQSEPAPPAPENDAAEEEAFDSAETTSDWRRNAMDFEIPADVANKPAFAGSEDLDRAMFPSERDYPPRRVTVPDPADEDHDPIVEDSKSEPEVAEPVVAETPEASVAPVSVATPEQSVEEAPAIEPESAPEPEDHGAAAPHWMDTLAGSSGEHGDWTKGLAESPLESAQSSVSAESTPEVHVEAPSTEETPASPSAETNAESSGPLFAEEPVSDESPRPWLAKVEDSGQVPFGVSAPSADVSQGESGNPASNFDLAPEIPAPSLREPDLIESAAVRVTPEPLLVDETPAAGSEYGARGEQSSEQPPDFAIASSASPVEQPSEHESAGESEQSQSIFASTEVADAEPGPDGRFQTLPPPNREALSDIPFLMPPPDFHDGAQASAGPSPETINAVVQKVLEKLQPQLQDLLSKGVLAPLVENLLQDELAKKER